jgi:hypothetical protein
MKKAICCLGLLLGLAAASSAITCDYNSCQRLVRGRCVSKCRYGTVCDGAGVCEQACGYNGHPCPMAKLFTPAKPSDDVLDLTAVATNCRPVESLDPAKTDAAAAKSPAAIE